VLQIARLLLASTVIHQLKNTLITIIQRLKEVIYINRIFKEGDYRQNSLIIKIE